MRNLEKYKGVIPAFYACYDEKGEVSPEGFEGIWLLYGQIYLYNGCV